MSSPSNQMDSEFQETMQDSIFSTPVTNTGVDVTFPPHPSTSTGKRKQPSEVWLHFSQQPNDKRRAACNYCGTLISRNGTSTMRTHLTRCLQYPGSEKNKRRKDGPFPQAAEGQVGSGIVSSPTVFKFDQDICRTELVRMFIAAELPFRFVENEAFRQFLSVLQPRFVVISR
ncbi:uncharacterized protein LOC130719923 [Lotus japonicus]|uniref:uncharacterized protein LOC130719923 n=1 Tax=Lotus japonicus TaxID=34305 RepID=UPI0025843937|nr:uncharacterized protein LOC130719923 [Lotus japonicus]